MVLRIQDLHFSFQNDNILRNVNLGCGEGEFASLLGASGCGKSTLLRLIAGLKQPTAGAIHFDRGAHELAFVFQKPTLCPWLSASQNVELPLKIRGIDKADRQTRVREAFDRAGLRRADGIKIPSQLSGGMQMRVSLARAFVSRPSFLLMDEPFSALDEILRQQLCETTLQLCQSQSWTTLFVTHNVAEAVFMSQRIHILAGRPATIVASIEVPFSNRVPELRLTSEFQQFVADIGQQLRVAVESAATNVA